MSAYNLMTKLTSAITFVACFLSLAGAAPSDVPPSSREYIEWCDIRISHAKPFCF